MAMATTPDAGDVDLAGSPRSALAWVPGQASTDQAATKKLAYGKVVGRGARAPLPVAAAVAGLWAAIVSYAPLLCFALLTGTGGGFSGVARFAAAGWLLGLGVPIGVGPATVTLTPLLVTAWSLWRLSRAGVHTARAVRRRGLPGVLVASLAVGLVYALMGAVVAVWAGASPARSALTLGLAAVVMAGLGAVGRRRAGRKLRRWAPPILRDAGRTGLSATALLLGLGAAAVGVTLAIHGGDAASMFGSYRTGLLGQAGITLLCLGFAPNFAVWGTAYLLGPGFALGIGTVVSPGLVAVGPVPTVPVLAGLPLHAVSGLGSALLGVPLVGAMACGALLARHRPTTSWVGLLGAAALAGPVAGVLLGVAAWASGGSLGSQRLTEIGPGVWSVGGWAALVVSAGAVVGALAVRALHRPDRVVR
jgi:hypothetical protein